MLSISWLDHDTEVSSPMMIGGKIKWNPKGGEIPNLQIIVSVELEHEVCFPSSLTIYTHFCEAESSIQVLQGSKIWETKQLEHVTVGQLDKVFQLYETLESVLTNLKATHGNTTQMLNKNSLMIESFFVGVSRNIHEKHTTINNHLLRLTKKTKRHVFWLPERSFTWIPKRVVSQVSPSSLAVFDLNITSC